MYCLYAHKEREARIHRYSIYSLEYTHSNVKCTLEEIKISEDEELEIKELASRNDIYELFTKSIAPSIFGMDRVKESLMLQLFGGVARLNPDGTRNRGDIHILLMGDPGVAKSQLLNYMSRISRVEGLLRVNLLPQPVLQLQQFKTLQPKVVGL